eukprot:1965329-Amphidinium_carterae.1
MSSLLWFNIAKNFFKGTLPEFLCQAIFMEGFSVAVNYLRLSGAPHQNIQHKAASRTSRSVFCPAVFKLCSVERSNCGISHFANLRGDFFGRGLEEMTSLTLLDASTNEFTGQIPQSIKVLALLEKFVVSDNELAGMLRGAW